MEEFVQFANEDVILEILDAVGNLELARQHIQDKGLEGIVKEFEKILEKYGIQRITVAGQKFDPTLHEAADAIIENKELAEVRPGYTMHGRVIRPSRVTVK